MVALTYHNAVAQVALGFGRFFTHQVTHAGAIALDFPLASHRKTLLGAGVGLHFRHDKFVFEKRSAKVEFSRNSQKERRKIVLILSF